MKFRTTTLVMAAVLMSALALPAAADEPNTPPDAPWVNTFESWNPCLGIVEEYTIVFTPFDHFHDNNVVFQDKNRHGWTESGFVMEHGQFHVVGVEDGVFIQRFLDIFRHPDGQAFLTKGTVRFAGSSPVVDDLRLTCLTGPTIPQD